MKKREISNSVIARLPKAAVAISDLGRRLSATRHRRIRRRIGGGLRDLRSLAMTSCEKGFVLITVYFLIMALSATALAVFMQSSSFLKTADRNLKRIVAFNIAEAGFDIVFLQLKNNAITTFPYSTGYVSMNSGSVRGGYSVTVTDMGNGVKKIAATGYSPMLSSTAEAVENRLVTGYVSSSSGAQFSIGIFAKETAVFTGNARVDSYDSSLGAYGQNNKGSAARVTTDAMTAASLNLTGNAQINGNVTTGVASNPNLVITTKGNAKIIGTKAAATTVVNPQLVTTSMLSSGSLMISGNTTQTLVAGSYRFDSIMISGNARLVTTGPVTLYVDNLVAISGNGQIKPAGNLPSNMTLYQTATSKIDLSGNAHVYGAVYAPKSAVNITGNGQIFGSVTSRIHNQSGNGRIHHDISLKGVGATGSGGLGMLSWKEGLIADSNSSPTSTLTCNATPPPLPTPQ